MPVRRKGEFSMNVTCKNILSLPYANQLKLLAGKEGMNHVISWVYYMEDYHYVDWLKGGELVIVTGLVTREEEGMLLDLINALYEKNVAGVVINLSFYIREIPQAVIDRGNFLGLPIFEMPAMLRIVDVSQSICFAIFKEETSQYDVNVTLFGILSGSRITAKRLKRLEAAGYRQGSAYRAVVIRIRENGTDLREAEESADGMYQEAQWDREFHRLDQVIREYLRTENILTTSDEDAYIWIAPMGEEKSVQEFKEAFREVFLAHLHAKTAGESYTLGIGNVFRDLKDMKASVDNAEEAIRLGQSENPEEECFFYDNMIVLRLFEKFEDKKELTDIAAQILQDLMLPENEELLRTLIRYVKCGFQAKKAAEELFIHENTMHYRLHKIEEMLKVNFKDAHDTFSLTLAVEIVRATQK